MMNNRKRLQPIDTNQFNILSNSVTRLTRSKNESFNDENLCRTVKVKLELLDHIPEELLSENYSNPIVMNRKRCCSITTTSTDSISESKSISHLDLQENNEILKETSPQVSHSKLIVSTEEPCEHMIKVSEFYYMPTKICGNNGIFKVKVPSWKVIPRSIIRHRRRTSLKTEDLSDDVFKKRHEKFEIDEKRVEKDMERSFLMAGKPQKSFFDQKQNRRWENIVLKTLEPEKYYEYDISVKNEVPITAFGVPLPFIEERSFKIRSSC